LQFRGPLLVLPGICSVRGIRIVGLVHSRVIWGCDSRPMGTATAWPPVRRWIGEYEWRHEIIYDVLAGCTVGVMAIPQSLVYALIAGLPPQFGLYSDLQIMYPLMGTTKYLVVGPVAVMSLMSRLALEKLKLLEEGSTEWIDMVCLLSVLVSLVQLVIWATGLGQRLSDFLPESAVAGFSSAAALIIGSTQLSSMFGLPKCRAGSRSCDFFQTVWHTGAHLHESNPASVLCGLVSVCVLLGFRRLHSPGNPSKHVASPAATIPCHGANVGARKQQSASVRGVLPRLGALVVVFLGIAFASWLHSSSSKWTLSVVGEIPSGLPSPRWAPRAPRSLAVGLSLLWSAVPIALVGFAEAMAIAKTSTKMSGGDPRSICANEEALALACCNAFTAWVGGYPVTGSFSRTAINVESGARSALSTAIAAIAVVFVLLFFTPYLALLPKAAVSAIVLTAVSRLVDVQEFLRLLRCYQSDPRDARVFVFAAVFVTSLLFGVETGLIVGVVSFRLATTRFVLRQDIGSVQKFAA